MSGIINDNPNPFGCESQNGQILDYLRDGEAITSLECLYLCGSIRASGRIFDLRDKNIDIRDVWVKFEAQRPNGEKQTKRINVYNIPDEFAKRFDFPVDDELPKRVQEYALRKINHEC